MTAVIITRSALSDALDELRDTGSVHLDLGPMLGAPHPLRVGVDDVRDLLQTGEPTFSVEYGALELTVRREDGGLLTTLCLKL